MEEICANCNNWDVGRRRNPGELYCEKCKNWVIATQEKCSRFESLPFFGAYDKKERSTEAINEAKPSCFITTAVVNILGLKDDCPLLEVLRFLRAQYMQPNPVYRDLLMTYDIAGPEIAESLRKDENRISVAEDILGYLKKARKLIAMEMIEEAIALYKEMTEQLMIKYGIRNPWIGERAQEAYDQSSGGRGAFVFAKRD